MAQFLLFDNNEKVVRAINREFDDIPRISVEYHDVKDLIKSGKLDIIVSPANSYGHMDGGIDEIYMEIFCDIQHNVMTKIRSYKIKDRFKLKYLPVGSATLVETNNTDCPKLLCVPTMRIPGRLKEPDNIYFAFTAILRSTRNMKNVVIGVPGLGTGVGQISPEEFAFQMKTAYIDFINGKICIKNKLIIQDTGLGEFILKKPASK